MIQIAQGICAECQKNKRLDAHHVKPIWAFATELVCAKLQAGETDYIDDGDYEVWNSLLNLKAVCNSCHNRLEKEADRFWRESILNRYHPQLCFNYVQAKKNYKKFWKDGQMQI